MTATRPQTHCMYRCTKNTHENPHMSTHPQFGQMHHPHVSMQWSRKQTNVLWFFLLINNIHIRTHIHLRTHIQLNEHTPVLLFCINLPASQHSGLMIAVTQPTQTSFWITAKTTVQTNESHFKPCDITFRPALVFVLMDCCPNYFQDDNTINISCKSGKINFYNIKK